MSLRARLTLWFLILALVPSLFLSLFVLRQLVSTVEWWDSAGAEDALTSSVAVAKASLKRLESGLRLSAGPLFDISRQRPLELAPERPDRIFVERFLKDAGLDLYQVYRPDSSGWHRVVDLAPTGITSVGAYDLSAEINDGRISWRKPAQSVTGAFALLDSIAQDSLRPGPEIVAVGYALPQDFFLQLSAIQLGMGIFRRLSVYAEVYKWYFRVVVIAVLLLVAAVAVLAGRAIARHLTQPIATLSESLARVDGDVPVHVEPTGAPEIRSLAESFNAMTLRLNRARAELAAAERAAAWQGVARQVAHEIRNPLTTITLALENLRREFAALEPTGRERGQKSIDALRREFDALVDLADSFYALGSLPEIRPGRVDLNALVESLVALQPWPHVELAATLDPGRPMARGDERQLRRVLRNLVKNACEAQPGGGRVTIATRGGTSSETVVVEVADAGPGMDPATVARVFEPGFSTKGRGSGVGLTVSRRVVEQHGGSLDIETAPGRGTRVTVVLPALAEASA